MSNLVIIKQMIRLSRIIQDLREARSKLSAVNAKTEYFIVDGDSSSLLKQQVNQSVSNCLFTEKYLRSSVSRACQCLDGFDNYKMDPIDYISSSDIKNKFADLCRGEVVVSTINLSTGEIRCIKPEQDKVE